jgi:hypothetical protein
MERLCGICECTLFVHHVGVALNVVLVTSFNNFLDVLYEDEDVPTMNLSWHCNRFFRWNTSVSFYFSHRGTQTTLVLAGRGFREACYKV